MHRMTRQIHDLKSALAIDGLQLSGSLRLKVTGNSMLPSLWPGDLLTVQAQLLATIRPGDIVLYSRNSRFFVHRVQRILSSEFLSTRGDCMLSADPPVSAGAVLGKVVSVRRYGQETSCPRFSLLRSFQARALRRFELLQRIALWRHARRVRHSLSLPRIYCEPLIQS